MNRITSFLALSAIVVAGAFAGTAAQASAANVNVQFKVHNADTSASMIRSGAPSSGISGLINPAAAILPGGDDPATGFALFSLPAPNLNNSVQGTVSYANASDGISNLCTFTITVTRTAASSYQLGFSVSNNNSHCTAPSGPVNSTTGQFTSTTYELDWSR
ncbi:MAG: hypothetical protein QOF71_1720 [Candidatus Eremiobacteraeota bacterium]|jgi:hypothetical protein|nr:hypothetical protein [Candidatus Eremiobacteraeota bacterium]